MSSSKKIICKGTLRQVLYCRLEVAYFFCTFGHVGIFNPALESVLSYVASLPFSLVQLSPPPLPCVNKYNVYRGAMKFWDSDTCRKFPLQVTFFLFCGFFLDFV
jgi:hypothetical protein